MPWMVPARYGSPLSPLPLSTSVMLWSIAALTLVFAWPARRNAGRAYGVLTVSLLAVGALFLALR